MKAFVAMLSRLGRAVVTDVPPELDACENCRELDCTQAQWERCERRRARALIRFAEAVRPTERNEGRNDHAEKTET
jgi:hypothetical protein